MKTTSVFARYIDPAETTQPTKLSRIQQIGNQLKQEFPAKDPTEYINELQLLGLHYHG